MDDDVMSAFDVRKLIRDREDEIIIEWQDKKVVYKRYASLYFVACVDKDDNELIVLEQIHLFVEVLDRYFGNVCELDIIFNFHKAYYILDELFIAGHLQETSKAEVLRICSAMDEMMDESKDEGTTPGRSNAGRPTR
jgi:AP-1 complex subunit sigma 1/2